jgi:hypothetical protein
VQSSDELIPVAALLGRLHADLDEEVERGSKAIVFGHLLINALVGWWWANPIAALIMVPITLMMVSRGPHRETCGDDACRPNES